MEDLLCIQFSRQQLRIKYGLFNENEVKVLVDWWKGFTEYKANVV